MKHFFVCLLCLLPFSWLSAQDPAYPPASALPLPIVAAEYFIDTDPGIGQAQPIGITAGIDIAGILASVNTAGLNPGLHRIFVRTKSTEGFWSLASAKEFIVDFDAPYPPLPALTANLTAAEYFIDTDPGFGNANAIALTPAIQISDLLSPANITGLTNGGHWLCLRTRDANGKWSLTVNQYFIVDFDPGYPAPLGTPADVVAAEYFVDTDPGLGNATQLTIGPGIDLTNAALQAGVAGLSNGIHRLYLRTKGSTGKWSLTNAATFTVDADYAYPIAPAAAGNITRVEYFIDTDPGFGNGTSVNITPDVQLSNISVAANTAALADGAHSFFIRSLDDWSITSFAPFVKGEILPLQFLQVSAAASGAHVWVNWTTAAEINTDYFVVEYSKDAIHFEPVGTKPAANTAGVHHYQWLHTTPGNGWLYYRIRQVDVDASFSYSPVAKVKLQPNVSLIVAPNPASDIVRLYGLPAADVKGVQIITAQGQLLQQYLHPMLLEWNIQSLPAGKYILQVNRQNGTAHALPFIKQ